MTIYQTIITKKILERIESESDVTWNSGCRPTMYYNEEDTYLNISDELYSPIGSNFTDFSEMSLWSGDRYNDRTLCTEEEFIEHCKRLKPKSK